jgi:predicted nucleotidyltransferase
MTLTLKDKEAIKRKVAESLSREREVTRVVVFGSFLSSPNPHDLDVAVFQDSHETYLPLALRYRRDLRSVALQIPIDVIPLTAVPADDPFLAEIERGETIYER